MLFLNPHTTSYLSMLAVLFVQALLVCAPVRASGNDDSAEQKTNLHLALTLSESDPDRAIELAKTILAEALAWG